jgi:uracil-DNA glycosylase
MDVHIEETWRKVLASEFDTPYFTDLILRVQDAYQAGTDIYPPRELIFNAFELCPFDDVKAVILGQDPYHGERQAHGLCFSVQDGVKVPPSLKNIYKELQSDLNIPIRTSGDLSSWAQQGVLLLNATLTVEAGKAGSHQGLGWEKFTDAIIRNLSEKKEHLVFLLWGKYAQDKGAIIDTSKHLVLKAPHPSPFSAYTGFFGCKHFSKTNEYLRKHEEEPIDW